jgi:hypothetical protein
MYLFLSDSQHYGCLPSFQFFSNMNNVIINVKVLVGPILFFGVKAE